MRDLYDELFSQPMRSTSFEECSLCALGKDHTIEEHEILIDDVFCYASPSAARRSLTVD